MRIDVNNSAVKAYSKRLKQMHRSDFPVSVRQTLNDMAFDVKQKTLKQEYNKQFIVREKSFLKAHSGVKKATGFNINSMKSTVGLMEKSGTNKVVKGLYKQETGGRISNRSMIYTDTARTSRNKTKRVRRQNYIGTKRIVKGAPNRKRSQKSQFIANAAYAYKNNLYLLEQSTLFDVKTIKFGKGRNRKVYVKMLPIASYKPNRSVNLRPRPFMEPAAIRSHSKANSFFIRNAQKRFKK